MSIGIVKNKKYFKRNDNYSVIKISRQEKDLISSTLPKVHITVANREHVARDKTYYMEPDKRALRMLVGTNIEARKELLWRVQDELDGCWNKKKKEALRAEIRELKESL